MPRPGAVPARYRQIAVIGYSEDGFLPEHGRAAFEVGRCVAESGSVLITGGLGGVMEEACRGASEAGGITMGIIPQEEAGAANRYCQIVVPSGMGMTRDFLNALAADGLIIVGGGVGTLSEACAAYMHGKPTVAVLGTGGIADAYAGKYLDHRRRSKIVGAATPGGAVRALIAMIGGRGFLAGPGRRPAGAADK